MQSDDGLCKFQVLQWPSALFPLPAGSAAGPPMPCGHRCTCSVLNLFTWGTQDTLSPQGYSSPSPEWGGPASSFKVSVQPTAAPGSLPQSQAGSGLPLNSHRFSIGVSWFPAMPSPLEGELCEVSLGHQLGASSAHRTWHLGANKG